MSETLKVTETAARSLLEAMGLPMGAKGTLARLSTKLNQVPKWQKSASTPEGAADARLLDKILACMGEGGSVEVVADAPDEAPAPAKPKSKAAPAKASAEAKPKAEAPPAPAVKSKAGGTAAKPKAEALPTPPTPAAKPKAGGKPKPAPEGAAEVKPSNKGNIYQKWLAAPDTPLDELHRLGNDVVKATTIKHWISCWKRGQKLPAVAKTLKGGK